MTLIITGFQRSKQAFTGITSKQPYDGVDLFYDEQRNMLYQR